MRQNHRIEAEQRERMPRAQEEISECFAGRDRVLEGGEGGVRRKKSEGLREELLGSVGVGEDFGCGECGADEGFREAAGRCGGADFLVWGRRWGCWGGFWARFRSGGRLGARCSQNGLERDAPATLGSSGTLWGTDWGWALGLCSGCVRKRLVTVGRGWGVGLRSGQSGVALRFPPHSKAVALAWAAGKTGSETLPERTGARRSSYL